MAIPIELRLAVEDLYSEYSAALDEGRYEDWAALFTEDGARHFAARPGRVAIVCGGTSDVAVAREALKRRRANSGVT